MAFQGCGSVCISTDVDLWAVNNFHTPSVHWCVWTILSCSGRHVSDKPVISQRPFKWARLHLHDSIAPASLRACWGQTRAPWHYMEASWCLGELGWSVRRGEVHKLKNTNLIFLLPSFLIWRENTQCTVLSSYRVIVFGQCCSTLTHTEQKAI